MKISKTKFDGLLLLEPTVYADERGYLIEVWKQSQYRPGIIGGRMLQDNLSWSRRGVLRGMHFQNPCEQEKLVSVLSGEVFDVVVDVRRGSHTFREWFSTSLSSDNHRQLYIPAGFAHGFCVLSESALVAYKSTCEYCPQAEMALAWNDPELAIEWPISRPILSTKDQAAPSLKDIPWDRLPQQTINEAAPPDA